MRRIARCWVLLCCVLAVIFPAGCPRGDAPTAWSTTTSANGLIPLALSFVDASMAGSSTNSAWAWPFGDGGAQRPSHVPTAAIARCWVLAYSVLAVVFPAGCTHGEAPTASFTATPASGPAPLTVSFLDTSTAGSSPITGWAWTFGDGATSAVQHPSHTYAGTGTYDVSLTVTDSAGSDAHTEQNCITVTAYAEVEGEGQAGGSLHVAILPPSAVADGAVWTLDHGFNHESGQTVDNVAPGPHTISFKDLGAGWTTPAGQVVTVTADQTTEVTGQYAAVHAPGDERTFAGIVFKWLPPGAFGMGTLNTSAELTAVYRDGESFFDPEHPRHDVTITRGFWLGKFEVTQAQWTARMSGNPSANAGATRPVERVSWDDCQSFIAQLNQLGQGVFRLPTEAEWEYACRAGTETEFYWGDDAGAANDYAWHCLDLNHCKTQPVGELLPNAWGLYDMSGNVMEWCHDCYDPAYYTADAVTDPQGPPPPASGYVFRVRRGGGTDDIHDIAFCRSAMRYYNIQGFVQGDTGFRLLRESDD